jgi:uncharacterized protein
MVGRLQEKKDMLGLLAKSESQLIMLTGRRRVGKTFLINNVYNKQIVFSFTGTQKGLVKSQLAKFETRLQFYAKNKLKTIEQKTWADAFINLTTYIQKLPKSITKPVVFFDEFPWINYNKSNFLEEFSYWWNEYATKLNIVVAITGSDTAWMINKIIKHRGGLHNRVTKRIHLSPFTLAETKQHLQTINPKLSNYDITQLYMCMGGIPLYLNQIQKGETPSQSIYNICFKKNGLLTTEFDDLFSSLFEFYENHVLLLKLLASSWQGLTRAQLVTKSKLKDGGTVSKTLADLEACNFIIAIQPLQNKSKGMLYRLADEYCRFYFQFIKNKKITSREWIAYQNNNVQYKTWQGYAFENICIKHHEAIKHKLGIAGIVSNICSFVNAATPSNKGFQIDMLIDRADNAINLCEIKFYNKPIIASKTFNDALQKRNDAFIQHTKTPKAVYTTLVSTHGIDTSKGLPTAIDNQVLLEDLFVLPNFD